MLYFAVGLSKNPARVLMHGESFTVNMDTETAVCRSGLRLAIRRITPKPFAAKWIVAPGQPVPIPEELTL